MSINQTKKCYTINEVIDNLYLGAISPLTAASTENGILYNFAVEVFNRVNMEKADVSSDYLYNNRLTHKDDFIIAVIVSYDEISNVNKKLFIKELIRSFGVNASKALLAAFFEKRYGVKELFEEILAEEGYNK